jgi:hypothetical protein
MCRPQFSLKTLLWLMAVVGAYFAGGEWQRATQINRLQTALRGFRDYEAAGGCMRGADEDVRELEAALERLTQHR